MERSKKQMERCPISLVTRETQTQTAMRYDFIPTAKDVFKSPVITSVGKDVGKLEPPHANGGHA